MTSSTPNPTETISDEAVEAAAEAIRQHWDLPESSIRPHVINDARVALAAAFPALRAQIETELRQQIARELGAEASDVEPPWHSPPEVEFARSSALRYAARLALGKGGRS